jgi:hypothetical protein
VTFYVLPIANSLNPPYPLSCVTKVVWKFSDGDVVLSPYEPYERTLPPGGYNVPVQIYNNPYPTFGVTTTLPFTIGRGLVHAASLLNDFPEGSPASFRISRTNADVATTVGWVIRDSLQGNATPTSGLSPATGSVTLAAGELSQVVSVPTTDDAVFQGNKTYYVQITSTTNDYFSDRGFTYFNVLENDLAIIDFVRPLTVREDAGTATIKVQRTGFLPSPVSVSFDMPGYKGVLPASGVLNFAAGETLKTFNVTIVDDNEWSGDRNLEMTLSGLPPSARFPDQASSDRAPLTIVEDEPTPRLTVADVSVAEGNSWVSWGSFTVKLAPPVESLTVYYDILDESAKGGIDYVRDSSGYLSFHTPETVLTVPFQILGDTVREPNKTFKLRIRAASNPHVALPPDATCTILNDDPLFAPSTASIAKGRSQRFSLDIGLPAPSALSLPIRVTDASVLTVPAFLKFSPGQSSATFDAVGANAGTARITVQLPPENGGAALEAAVTVHEGGTAVFEPAAINVIAGAETTVKISLDPASAQEQRLQLTSGNGDLAAVPSEVIVPAGGSGTFTVKGLAPGATYVKAFLPASFGEGYVIALLDVSERATTPAITSIEPSSGPAAGGTTFLARGALLTGDCTLLFGGAPATNYALTSEGMLLGSTPPHANGPVDVTLQCGTSTFVLTNAFTYLGTPRTRSARH